jgi:pyruvate dehydrogenase E2 component (dihydrolipoamide acetyltransferase)
VSDPAAPPAAADAQSTVKGGVTVTEPTRLEAQLARRVAESKATVPDAWAEVALDAGATGDADVVDVLLAAIGRALREDPRANGAYRDARFERYGRANVALVVPGPDGPLTPTLLDADRKSVAELAAERRALTARAAAGELTGAELRGATTTLLDLGPTGVERAAAVLPPGQAVLLVAGAVEPRAVVRDGAVVARRTLTLVAVTDQRILPAAGAAAFLGRVKAHFEQA